MGFFGLFSSQPKLYTGKILSAVDVRLALGASGPLAQLGKQFYAEVDSLAVVWMAQQARDELFKLGVPRWNPAATCTLAAANFAVNSEALFSTQAFNDPIANGQPISLGIATIWYHPDGLPFGQNHAIGLCFTQQGPLAIDPQAPDALRVLSDTERQSIVQAQLL